MKYVIIAIVGLGLIGGGYYLATKNKNLSATNNQQTPTQNKVDNNDDSAKTTKKAENTSELKLSGVKIVGNYYQYSKADYQAALAANRPIFLFFYANWCPTCAQQEPIVQDLMGEIQNQSQLDDVIAFRVNFNDPETDKDEEALAREYGVTYQHTMFALDEDGNQVQKLLGQTSKEALKTALQKAVDA